LWFSLLLDRSCCQRAAGVLRCTMRESSTAMIDARGEIRERDRARSIDRATRPTSGYNSIRRPDLAHS